MKTILKYMILVLIFIILLFFYIFHTTMGNKIAYFYLSDTLSEKTRLEVKVKTINLYDYPDVFGEILIEDKYSLNFQGSLHDFKPDIHYTITSNCIETNICTIDDSVKIVGKITGDFKNVLITGEGEILDGNVSYEGIKKRKSFDNVNITLSDINATKLFDLFKEKALLDGKANAHIHFDTIGKYGKKGTVTYSAKDNNLSGLIVKLDTEVFINDRNYTFGMNVSTPTSTLNIRNGKYSQDKKYATADYILDIKDLEEYKSILGVKLTGPFYALGELVYDKKIKMQGVSKSFGGLLDIVYKEKKFLFYLDDIPFDTIMQRLTYAPLLNANMTGKVDYDLREKDMTTKIKLEKVKFIQKDLVKLVRETYGHNLDEEIFKNSSFEATYKDKVLSSFIKMENDNNHLILQNTKLDSAHKSIDTTIDMQIDKHNISGKLYVRHNGYADHTLDTYLRFDGLAEKYYKLKLDGPLSQKGINLDYTLSSERLPSPICTIVDDINVTGQIHGPFKRLYISGDGKALDGNISYDGIKIHDTLEKFTLKMDNIHALKLSTLLGLPDKLPHGRANVDVNIDYLNKERKKGRINYNLTKGTLYDVPCTFNSKININNDKQTFSGNMILADAELNITKGIYNSDTNLLDAFYVLNAKDLTKLKPILRHKYKGPFYAMGTLKFDDQLEIRGLSKTFGGIVDFLYKKDKLYIDLEKASFHSITQLLSYPPTIDADTNGNINYDFAKDLLLVKAQLQNAKFLHTNIVDTIYEKSGVNMLKETFNDANLDINYQNSILNGNVIMKNEESNFSLTNTIINTKLNTINAYFDFKMQKQEFSGKVYGSLDHPEVNLNMQKLIRYQMDKQLDSVMGKDNRELMESMPMGDVAKDVASGVGASFMGMFF